MRLDAKIEGETWRSCLGTIFGVWLVVWVAAMLHDQYLIRIHPEHFTLWHYRIPFTRDYTLLAVLYALGASITPGFVLGMVLYVSGRLLELPKMPVRWILTGVVIVAVATEVCGLVAGFLAWRARKGIYPEWLYADDSVGLGITQSIQVTAYGSGAVFSMLLIGWIWWWRVGRRRT